MRQLDWRVHEKELPTSVTITLNRKSDVSVTFFIKYIHPKAHPKPGDCASRHAKLNPGSDFRVVVREQNTNNLFCLFFPLATATWLGRPLAMTNAGCARSLVRPSMPLFVGVNAASCRAHQCPLALRVTASTRSPWCGRHRPVYGTRPPRARPAIDTRWPGRQPARSHRHAFKVTRRSRRQTPLVIFLTLWQCFLQKCVSVKRISL